MTRYRGADGETWESRPGNRVSLVEVTDPKDAKLIGTPDYTDIPFDYAGSTHRLEPITGGVE